MYGGTLKGLCAKACLYVYWSVCLCVYALSVLMCAHVCLSALGCVYMLDYMCVSPKEYMRLR